jgi:hypothetical protein
MRSVMTRVLPEPAPATTTIGPVAAVTTRSWEGFKSVLTKVVLPALKIALAGAARRGAKVFARLRGFLFEDAAQADVLRRTVGAEDLLQYFIVAPRRGYLVGLFLGGRQYLFFDFG